MLTQKISEITRGNRSGIDLEDSLRNIHGAKSYGQIIAAVYEFHCDLHRLGNDLQRAFAILVCATFVVMGLLFSIGGPVAFWMCAGPVAGYIYVEYTELCETPQNVVVKLNKHLAVLGGNLLDGLTGGSLGAISRFLHGPLESSGTNVLRDILVLVGIGMASAGGNGFALLGLVKACMDELPRWNNHLVNFFMWCAMPTRGTFATAFGKIPKGIRTKIFGSSPDGINRRAHFAVGSLLAGIFGTWFVHGRKRGPGGRAPKSSSPVSSDDGVRVGGDRRGLGYSEPKGKSVPANRTTVLPSKSGGIGPMEGIHPDRIGKRKTTKRGNFFWEYEDEQGNKFVRSLIDGDLFTDTQDTFKRRLIEEEDELIERMYGDYAGDAEKSSPTSQRTLRKEGKKQASPGQSSRMLSGGRLEPTARDDKGKAPIKVVPMQSSASSPAQSAQGKAVSPSSPQTQDGPSTSGEGVSEGPARYFHGDEESALGGSTFSLKSIHMGSLIKKGTTERVCCSFFSGSGWYPYHSGLTTETADQWELYTAGRDEPWPIKGKCLPVTGVPDQGVFRLPDGVHSTKLPRKALTEAQSGVLVTCAGGKFGVSDLRLAPGQIMVPAKNGIGRYRCASLPGDCGGMVIATGGQAPVVVGFHGYGDNGTGTNGYHAITPAMEKAFRETKWPKNS